MSKPFFGKSHFAAIIARFVGTYQPSGAWMRPRRQPKTTRSLVLPKPPREPCRPKLQPTQDGLRDVSCRLLNICKVQNRAIIQWRIIHATTPIEGRLKIGRP